MILLDSKPALLIASERSAKSRNLSPITSICITSFSSRSRIFKAALYKLLDRNLEEYLSAIFLALESGDWRKEKCLKSLSQKMFSRKRILYEINKMKITTKKANACKSIAQTSENIHQSLHDS